MSIIKARYNGDIVYASKKFIGVEVRCMCDARMHARRKPLKEDEFIFVLYPGEEHKGACGLYDNLEKNCPQLKFQRPEDYIDWLSKPVLQKDTNVVTNRDPDRETDRAEPKDKGENIPSILSLKQLIWSGKYDEQPYDKAGYGLDYYNIDLVIFDKWANLIWKDDLVNISSRIVDTRWAGSFNYDVKTINRIETAARKEKSLWFRTFWQIGGKYKSVVFCFNCQSCFSEVKKKLFVVGTRENDTYTEFKPKVEGKLDVLVASKWAPMNKEQCKETCPIQMCQGCLGAYWGKCNSVKQIEAFPEHEQTKRKGNKHE